MKKVLSLVLVIAMVLSSMSFAFASTFEDVSGDYEKAIDALSGLGIITGYEDGTFRPEKTITRAEMAKLMVEILGYGNLVAGAKSNFSDTQGHWADQWIAIAAGRNIVVGTGDGKFTPDRQVSYDEVLTMIVRGLGYTDDSNEIKSMSWPTNFKVKAAEIGVTEGVKMTTTGADRGGVAQALFNALKAVLVSVDTDGNVTTIKDNEDSTINKLLITRIATVVGNKNTKNFTVVPEFLDPNNVNYKGDLVDLTPYMYERVEAYASRNDEDKIVYIGESFTKTVEGTFVADFDKDSDGKAKKTEENDKIAVELADESKEVLKFDQASIEVYYNGKKVTSVSEQDLENGTGDMVNLETTGVADVKVVLDADGNVEKMVVSNPTFANQVVSGYKTGSLRIGRILLPKKGDNVDLSKVTVTGAVDDINDIEADDVVVAYAAAGDKNDKVPSKTTLVVVRDTVEGTITKVNKNTAGDVTTAYVDGVKFSVSDILGRTATFDVGFEGTFFLDDLGKLFAEDATEIASAKDYAVVIAVEDGDRGVNQTVIAKPSIKLINAAGEVVTHKVDKDAKYKDKSPVIDTTDETKFVVNKIGSRALIKYKLDGDVIDAIEIIDSDVLDKTAAELKVLSTETSKFEVAQDAPIFCVQPDAKLVENEEDKDFYSVVDAENLPSTITVVYRDYTSTGQYKVLVSTDADRSAGTYALITGANYIMDGNKKVAEITAYVDGKEVTYLSTNADEVTDVNKGLIKKFTLKNGKVDAILADDTLITEVTTPSSLIASISKTRLEVKDEDGNTQTFDLDADNIVVYVLKSDNKFDYVEENIKNVVGLTVWRLSEAGGSNGYRVIVVK